MGSSYVTIPSIGSWNEYICDYCGKKIKHTKYYELPGCKTLCFCTRECALHFAIYHMHEEKTINERRDV